MQRMQICNVSAQMYLEKIHRKGEEHFEKNITQSVFFWADRETLRNNRYLREKRKAIFTQFENDILGSVRIQLVMDQAQISFG